MTADQLETVVDLFIPHDLADMQPHVQHLQHVGRPHGIPGVENVVVTETDVDVRRQHLLHPGDAAAFWIAVEAPLQVDIHQRIGDEVEVRQLQQPEQARRISPVVGVHGGGVAGGHPLAHAALVGQGRQRLDEAGLLIIDLVTVHIHQNLILLGKIEHIVQTFDPVFPGKLEMGDGTDHVGTQLEGLFQQRLAVRVGEDPLLREGDDLQLHPLLHLFPHLQHRLESDQIGIGDIDMGTDELDTVGDLPLQRLDGAPFHILVGQHCLALGPAFDPLEQGAGEVPARLARRLGGIEMDVRFDKGGNGEPLLPIQLMGGEQMSAHGLDGTDQAILAEDLPGPLPAGQAQVLYQHVFASFFQPPIAFSSHNLAWINLIEKRSY